MARAWFLRVLLNSSSFSAILRSTSCFTCPSSRAPRRTCFLQLQERIQPPLKLLEVPPFQPQVYGAVCQAHGWSGPHLPIDQEGP